MNNFLFPRNYHTTISKKNKKKKSKNIQDTSIHIDLQKKKPHDEIYRRMSQNEGNKYHKRI